MKKVTFLLAVTAIMMLGITSTLEASMFSRTLSVYEGDVNGSEYYVSTIIVPAGVSNSILATSIDIDSFPVSDNADYVVVIDDETGEEIVFGPVIRCPVCEQWYRPPHKCKGKKINDNDVITTMPQN